MRTAALDDGAVDGLDAGGGVAVLEWVVGETVGERAGISTAAGAGGFETTLESVLDLHFFWRGGWCWGVVVVLSSCSFVETFIGGRI